MTFAKKFWIPCILPIAFIACGGKPHTEWKTPRPKIHSFKVEPETITEGETAKLIASFEGIGKITPAIDTVGENVPIEVAPKETTEYTLTVKNGDWDPAVSSVTLKVLKAPDPTITAPPFAAPDTSGYMASVPYKEGLAYKWEVENGTLTSEVDKHSIQFSTPGSGVVTLSCTVSNGQKTLSETKKVEIHSGLNVMVTGLPPEAGKIIRVVGPSVNKLIDRSELLPNCKPGTYIVQVEKQFINLNGLNYSPWQSTQTVEVGANMTAQVEVIFPQPVCIVQIPDATDKENKRTIPMEFVLIPAGSFQMGSTNNPNSSPVRTVEFKHPFYMARTECTQAQWMAVMNANPSGGVINPMHPVDSVTWDMIQNTFIPPLNAKMKAAKMDVEFALPSEAQWEYACRAGSTSNFFFGDGLLGEYAWFGENSGIASHPVASTKKPNPWLLYDLLGNMWEWCEDAWHADYKDAPLFGESWMDSPTNGNHIIRGGSFDNATSVYQSHFRGSYDSTKNIAVGFRLVLKAPPFNDPKFSNPKDIQSHGGNRLIVGDFQEIQDPTKPYTLSVEAMAFPKTPGINTYIGVIEYDRDKQEINAKNHMYFKGTLATLKSELGPESQSLQMTCSGAWSAATTAPSQRRFIFWDWQDYGPETYSRHLSPPDLWEGADSFTTGTDGTITLQLKKKWKEFFPSPDQVETIKAGTQFSQANSGGTYKYCTLCVGVTSSAGDTSGEITPRWVTYKGSIGSIDSSGLNSMTQFSPGTKYIKLLFLCNYKNGMATTPSETVWYRNLHWEGPK